MSPYDDPAVSAGEIAEYLYCPNSQPMKYRILLALEVEADPADVGAAARQGFNKLAQQFNSGKPITLHLLPQDGSHEAILAEQILDVCFQAHSTPRL